jgi:hypothetical protein
MRASIALRYWLEVGLRYEVAGVMGCPQYQQVVSPVTR